MRVVLLFIVAATLGVAAVTAQTNRAPAINLGTNRPITLPEAIQMALDHNLAIQIERFNPRASALLLSSSRAIYEPTFRADMSHNYRQDPSGYDAQGRPFSSNVSESDSYSADLSGTLPTETGLRYDLFANLGRNNNSRPFSDGTNDFVNSSSLRPGSIGVTLTQPLLRNFLTDDNRTRIELNRRTLKQSEYTLRQTVMESLAKVEQAYYTLIFTRENVKVQETAYQLAQQLLRETRKKVELGAMAALDERSAESQAASNESALLEAQRAYSEQINTVKALLTDDFSSMLNIRLDPVENLVAVPAFTSLQESWAKGLTMRPEIVKKKLDLEKADINIKFSKNQVWPSLDLKASYGQSVNRSTYWDAIQDYGRDNAPNYSVGGSLIIPLGNTVARNNLKTAKLSKNQELLNYKQLEQSIMVDIDNAIKSIQSSFERVQSSRAARSYAKDALFAEQKRLEAGKGTSYLVLQAQRDLTQRQYEEIQALANYNIALSQLALREGTTLERNGLTITVK